MHRTNYRTLAHKLEKHIPKHRIATDFLRRLSYGTDASFYRLVPEIVVTAESETEVIETLSECAKAGASVTFRAAGTSLSGQAITDSVLIVLGDGWRKSQIFEGGLEIALQPGVIGAEANRRLAPYGRKIGPDPASISAAMIGGIAANNASGMCCGTAQNSYKTLKSMRVVLAGGEVLDTGSLESRAAFSKKNAAFLDGLSALASEVKANSTLSARIKRKFAIKNTTGYSLNALVDFEDPVDILQHLMIGSEGTLGFISEITYHTVADHQYKAAGLLFFDTLVEACRAVTRLKSEPVAAVELIDRAGLACVTGAPGMPDFLASLGDDATALLVEIQGADDPSTDANVETVTRALKDTPPSRPAGFTKDHYLIDKYWKIRKGLFPAVGASRPTGTTVIIEDVAVPIQSLAPATADLQAALKKHGYKEAIIFGHALDGNLHFVFAQGFSDKEAINRYAALMDEVADIIVTRYDGSLKAEHGTGRNVAPFVEMEWGKEATELMWRIKRLFDPKGLLNPGVVLNEDKNIHLKNFKPMLAADPLVDRCIECGYCEPLCPTRGLTVTPRQRIAGMREVARLTASKAPARERKAFEREYFGFSIGSCVGCGMCETACPDGINTGKLTHAIHERNHGAFSNAVAGFAGRNYGTALGLARTGLRAAAVFDAVTGNYGLDAAGGLARAALGPKAPLISHASIPKAGKKPPRDQNTPKGGKSIAVYFPSCAGQSFGPSRDDPDGEPLSATLHRLADKAGFELISPPRLENSCCGQPFECKGFEDEANRKAEEVIEALIKTSENGRWPVFADTSPCSHRLKHAAEGRLEILDISEFLHDLVLPRVSIPERSSKPVALHMPCSTKRMGIGTKLLAVAKACSSEVIVPPDIQCCGFAGDRGFTQPEINAHALRNLKPQVQKCDGGYSTSRTCELGLSMHGGIPYRSLAHLLDHVSKPKETNEKAHNPELEDITHG